MMSIFWMRHNLKLYIYVDIFFTYIYQVYMCCYTVLIAPFETSLLSSYQVMRSQPSLSEVIGLLSGLNETAVNHNITFPYL